MITIRLLEYPWTLAIEDTKSPKGHTRKLSNSQMLLSFLLIVLWLPGAASQSQQLKWLKRFLGPWTHDNPNTTLLCALENLSRTQLDRYLEMINEAMLVLPDGSTTAFGSYLQANMESARYRFSALPRYTNRPNADWMMRALGIELPTAVAIGNIQTPDVPYSMSCTTFPPVEKPTLEVEFFTTPFDRFMGRMRRMRKRVFA